MAIMRTAIVHTLMSAIAKSHLFWFCFLAFYTMRLQGGSSLISTVLTTCLIDKKIIIVKQIGWHCNGFLFLKEGRNGESQPIRSSWNGSLTKPATGHDFVPKPTNCSGRTWIFWVTQHGNPLLQSLGLANPIKVTYNFYQLISSGPLHQ